MNNKSKATKLSLVILLMAFTLPSGVFAQDGAGIFGSYIGINANGAGNSWYGAQEWGNNLTDFNLLNLGDININTGSLVLSAFEVHTYKFGNGDITGANLLYRVFELGTTPGTFNSVNASWLSNSPFNGPQGSSASGTGDQKWGRAPGSYANLLGGLTNTGKTYNVEVYFDAGSTVGGISGTQYSNNSGSNYTASFNLVPEPSSASLIALGTVGLLALRRRRNG